MGCHTHLHDRHALLVILVVCPVSKGETAGIASMLGIDFSGGIPGYSQGPRGRSWRLSRVLFIRCHGQTACKSCEMN